jgi:UDP-glucose 4-epimerase
VAVTGSVLVTGGCGFIGVTLGRLLHERGWRVVAFDDLSTGSEADAAAAGYADVVVGDVRDAAGLVAAATGFDHIVHLAAQTSVIDSVREPDRDLDINARGTLNALVAARDTGAARFVFASSSAPLGDVDGVVHEEVVARPLSPYGASKLAGEALCSAFAASYGLATIALRFSNVYGPYSYHKGSVIATFFKAVCGGEPLVLYGDGSQTRDFVFVDDLCAGIVAALEHRSVGGVVHLGTGTATSISDLAAHMQKLFDDREISVVHEPARAGEIMHSRSDISRARELLDYAPGTTLADGLERTRDWFTSAA